MEKCKFKEIEKGSVIFVLKIEGRGAPKGTVTYECVNGLTEDQTMKATRHLVMSTSRNHLLMQHIRCEGGYVFDFKTTPMYHFNPENRTILLLESIEVVEPE